MEERRQHEAKQVRTYDLLVSLRSTPQVPCAVACRPCDPYIADPGRLARQRPLGAYQTNAAALALAEKRSVA